MPRGDERRGRRGRRLDAHLARQRDLCKGRAGRDDVRRPRACGGRDERARRGRQRGKAASGGVPRPGSEKTSESGEAPRVCPYRRLPSPCAPPRPRSPAPRASSGLARPARLARSLANNSPTPGRHTATVSPFLTPASSPASMTTPTPSVPPTVGAPPPAARPAKPVTKARSIAVMGAAVICTSASVDLSADVSSLKLSRLRKRGGGREGARRERGGTRGGGGVSAGGRRRRASGAGGRRAVEQCRPTPPPAARGARRSRPSEPRRTARPSRGARYACTSRPARRSRQSGVQGPAAAVQTAAFPPRAAL